MSKRGEMTPTLLMRPFRVTTIFPLLWSSMISKSPMYSAERAGRCEREKVARVLRRGCGVQCEPESSGQQTIKCPQVSTGRERWWCVHSVTAASHGRRTSQSGASVPALASRRLRCNEPFCITSRNLMITLLLGRIRTWRLPRFSAATERKGARGVRSDKRSHLSSARAATPLGMRPHHCELPSARLRARSCGPF